jgi:hypothetical protein
LRFVRSQQRSAVALGLATACALWSAGRAQAQAKAQTEAEHAGPNDGFTSFEVGLHGITPLRGYADEQIGAGLEAGVGLTFSRALVIATLGVRHSITHDHDDTFTHLPFEVNADYLFSDGEATPLIGATIGLHYLYEAVHVSNTIGSVLRSTSTDVIEDSVVGATIGARAGALFMRSQEIRWLLAVDYALTFAEFQERSSEHALRLCVIALVGGP